MNPHRFAIIWVLILANVAIARADTSITPLINPANYKIESLALSVQETRDAFIQTENERRQLLGSVYQIQDKVKRISRKKEQITTEMLGARHQIENLSGRIDEVKTHTETQRERIKYSIRTIHQFSGRGMVATLFSHVSGASLDRFLRSLKILSEYDAKLLSEYKANLKQLKRLHQVRSKEINRLAALQNRLKTQESQLVNEHARSKVVLAKIDKQQLLEKLRLQDLRSVTKQMDTAANPIDKALYKALQPSFFELKGQLIHPVNTGQIVEKFGVKSHPRLDIQFSHRGIFYGTNAGLTAVAVGDGMVGEVSRLPGFGNVVVLDHGHHYYTVYGNLDALSVKTGDTVVKGQGLGTSGKHDIWDRWGIYFEIRHFAEPEDPLTWLRQDAVPVAQGFDANSSR